MLTRRGLLKNGWHSVLGCSIFLSGYMSSRKSSGASTHSKLETIIQEITKDKKLNQGRVALSLPELALSQNAVPFRVSIDSPMTESDYVKKIHVLASENKAPRIASFFLTPLSGKAEVSSRMRLEKSQVIIAIAEMSDGTFYIGKRKVELAVQGFSYPERQSR